MITNDGWFDWAERVPGHPEKQNGGTNAVRGIFLHSAEGFETYLRTNPPQPKAIGGEKSWHLTNLFSGKLLQHYPLTAQCWHATAANNMYVGMEHEGKVPQQPSLTLEQIATSRRVITEISQKYGWVPSRPANPIDKTNTLWEHNEVVKLGGSNSTCPSGRIPWDKILLQEEEEVEMIRFNAEANPNFWRDKVLAGGQWMNAVGDLGLPPEARMVDLDVWLKNGWADILDGDGTSFAGFLGGDAAKRATVRVILNSDGGCMIKGFCIVNSIGCVSYSK